MQSARSLLISRVNARPRFRIRVMRYLLMTALVPTLSALAPAMAQSSIAEIGLQAGDQVFGCSPDAPAVVGRSSGLRAFRWTQAGGEQDLGTCPEMPNSVARGVSADGSVVAGSCYTDVLSRPFRWT